MSASHSEGSCNAVTYKHKSVAACCVDHDDCDWSVRYQYVLLCRSECVPLVSVFDLKRQTPAAATQHHCCTTSQKPHRWFYINLKHRWKWNGVWLKFTHTWGHGFINTFNIFNKSFHISRVRGPKSRLNLHCFWNIPVFYADLPSGWSIITMLRSVEPSWIRPPNLFLHLFEPTSFLNSVFKPSGD